MAKIFLVTPFPHWVEIPEEDDMPPGCGFILLILFLLGIYLIVNN